MDHYRQGDVANLSTNLVAVPTVQGELGLVIKQWFERSQLPFVPQFSQGKNRKGALLSGNFLARRELSRRFERALISKALERTGGRRIEAAALLGMGRNTITRKIQELGLDDTAGEE